MQRPGPGVTEPPAVTSGAHRTRRIRRIRVRPTPTGVVVALGLVAFMVVGPQVADPDMAGFVWAAVLGIAVVGVLWPCMVVWITRVGSRDTADPAQPTGAPRPVRVGEVTSVPVRVGPGLSEVTLRWVGSDDVAPVAVGPASCVDLVILPVRRGHFARLWVRVECDAPFGLVTASKEVAVRLARPLVVGPAEVPVDLLEPDTGDHGELAVTSVGHGGDTIRSVRPYVAGDPAHLVHWPTTARVGSLVVREMEPPADRAVAVVVDLGPSPAGASGTGASGAGAAGAIVDSEVMPTTPLTPVEFATEAAVARAAASITVLRRRGVRVLVCTADPGPSSVEVGDDVTVMSRLASATHGVPGPVPPGWSALRITPGGDRS